ncbi:MAG: molybdenum cofactor guanylyltransferase [Cyanobacteria bacterium P01_H01_bin.121]
MSTELFTGIVLVGGNSTRMGQDKALLQYAGQSMLYRTCQLAQQCCTVTIVVGPQFDHYHAHIPSDCQFVAEEREPASMQGPGPLVAFWHVLPQVQTEWILLLACDLPYLDLLTLQQWQHHVVQVPETAIACLAHHEQGWEPLCGFYRQRCYPNLTPQVQGGVRSFQHWLSQVEVAPLPVQNWQVLTNCNTPADWQQVITNG